MNFLLIRFRQMGDTVLITPVLDTLRRNFPDSRIDVVLNERLAPLLEGHPSVSNVITFSDKERHSLPRYIAKVWRVTHAVRYDAVIDFRSTVNTLLFSLFSLRSKIRSGVKKSYSSLVLNYTVGRCAPDVQMIDRNLKLLAPLEKIKPLAYCHRPTLVVRKEEHSDFMAYMRESGIDFTRPVMLAGVTAKLEHKAWDKTKMVEVIRRIVKNFPDIQIILNYAPGREEADARQIFEAIGSRSIFMGIEAKGIRKLMAMASCCTMYFGNEGGTRHIFDALGKPTFSICSPAANRYTWIPVGDNRHQAVCPEDLESPDALSAMTYEQRYALITPDNVWQKLSGFIEENRK